MIESRSILKNRLAKLEKHFSAIREFGALIVAMTAEKNIYEPDIYSSLKTEERAVLEAYLKRFSSIQDYLGSKIFPLLLDVRGIGTDKMSEVLDRIEKEEIIDSLDQWLEMREIRNELEHDYPDELSDALGDMKYCVDHLGVLETYYANVVHFVEGYL
jgi:hypothetical protein